MPTPATEVASITVERVSHVEVVFADGKACRFELEDLRQACPCASCGLARDRGRPAWSPVAGAAVLTIADAELVGAYGLGITWSDGHSTGIYSFTALRRACDARAG
jgi:DUF971 family protein